MGQGTTGLQDHRTTGQRTTGLVRRGSGEARESGSEQRVANSERKGQWARDGENGETETRRNGEAEKFYAITHYDLRFTHHESRITLGE